MQLREEREPSQAPAEGGKFGNKGVPGKVEMGDKRKAEERQAELILRLPARPRLDLCRIPPTRGLAFWVHARPMKAGNKAAPH